MPKQSKDLGPTHPETPRPRDYFARSLKRDCDLRIASLEASGQPYFLSPAIELDRDALSEAVVALVQYGRANESDWAMSIIGRETPSMFEPRQIADPVDARFVILEAMPFSERSRGRWRNACVRLEEWTESRTARGDLPPCHATHTRPEVKDCPLEQRLACAQAILEQVVGSRSPVLGKAIGDLERRMTMAEAPEAMDADYKAYQAGESMVADEEEMWEEDDHDQEDGVG